MAGLKWEQEREETSKIFAPAGKATARYDQGFLQLSVKLRRQFCIDELCKGFGFKCDELLAFRDYIIKSSIHLVQKAK